MCNNGWRDDLENAPRDGTELVVYLPFVKRCVIAKWFENYWVDRWDSTVLSDEPSHWQLLPEPPK